MSGLWAISGVLPCGARELKSEVLGPAYDGRRWLDVCVLGQHIPQMYPHKEIHELSKVDCKALGLCDTCYGFGDLGREEITDMRLLARHIDEIGHPCPSCAGSGRPALRVILHREEGSLSGEIRPLQHEYVPPTVGDASTRALFQAAEDMCLACGMPENGKGPREEALHV